MKYIRRTTEGIMILERKATYHTRGLKQYINDLCIKNLSTFEGREKAASKLLDLKSNLPIYVNEEIILFPTKSIRNYDCIYLNLQEVLTIQEKSKGLSKVIFSDLTEITIDVSATKMKRQMLRANTIYEFKNYN